MIEGSLEVKLPTIWTDGKAEVGRVKEEKKRSVRRSEKRNREKKEDAGARKGRKVAIDCAFPMICGSWGLKRNLAKAAGAEPAGQMRDEKFHAVVARSTCPSEEAKNTSRSDHFWKLRCATKSARCWGAKHIPKSKVSKTDGVGPLLEVEMSKKCTPLRREAHSRVKSVKHWRSQTTFGSWDVNKVHAVVARNTFPNQKCQELQESDHFWTFRLFRCRFAWQARRVVFLSTFKTMASVGHWNRSGKRGTLEQIWKDAFRLARAVQETCSSEMLAAKGIDFLQRVLFWSIRFSGLLKRFCVTGAALCMT